MTIPMPEPVMRIYAEGSMRTVTEWRDGACDLPDGDHDLITTDQAEAYAAAKARESLVQAESILRGNAKACKSLAVKVLLSANADAIGELIPPLPGPVEPTT